jgi:hypothetical protein
VRTSFLTFALCIISFGCKQTSEPTSFVPLTAAAKFAEVNSFAISYKHGIALVTVMSNVSIEGLSDNWQYIYRDTTTTVLPGKYCFHANSNGVGFDSISSIHEGRRGIIQSWLDSDSAVYIAENNGGSQFRINNPNCTITASLGGLTIPEKATIWDISYSCFSNDVYGNFLLLGIDANTGEVKYRITNIKTL